MDKKISSISTHVGNSIFVFRLYDVRNLSIHFFRTVLQVVSCMHETGASNLQDVLLHTHRIEVSHETESEHKSTNGG